MNTPFLPELLAPAGSMEKLEVALFYGADAVYLGGKSLNLRSAASGFSMPELRIALEKAHAVGAKVYYCLNSIIHDDQIPELEKTLEELSDIAVDGIIIADPGVLSLTKRYIPNAEIHLSTQANTVNRLSIAFWKEMGVHRVNTARELSVLELNELRKHICDVELEVFVHGAMCMAVSGQCSMSKWTNDRNANLGECSQPCRFSYTSLDEPVEIPLYEQKRTKDGQAEPLWYITQQGDYSNILASEDLCLIEYLPWFIKKKIDAIKIEGRMKSIGYLAYTVNAYRSALKHILERTFTPHEYIAMLYNQASRPLSTGFFLPKGRLRLPNPNQSKAKTIVARVEEKVGEGKYHVSIRKPWNAEEPIHFFYPQQQSFTTPTYMLEDDKGERRTKAHPGMHHILHCEHDIPVGILIEQ
ncbi:MAG: U32 family peptidase [Desulfovibrionaceae bacterium]|nr:U32 family peptidase [Desulfovibrionaceae bacterium]